MSHTESWSTLARTRSVVLLTALVVACGGGSSEPAPTLTAPPHDTVAFAGGSVTFAATATGNGLTYQWQRNGAPIAGATDARLVLPLVGLADDGARFTVTIRNAGGSVTSDPVSLRVKAAFQAQMEKPRSPVVVGADGSLRWLVQNLDLGMPLSHVVERSSSGEQVNRPLGQAASVLNAPGWLEPAPGAALYLVAGSGTAFPCNISFCWPPTAGKLYRIAVDGALAPLTPALPAGLRGLAVDSSGNAYTVAAGNIWRVAPDGTAVAVPGTQGADAPLAVDRTDRLYASIGGVMTRMRLDGQEQTRIPSVNAEADMGRMAFDASGNAYIGRCQRHTVERVTPQGEVRTVLGVQGSSGDQIDALPGLLTCPTVLGIDDRQQLYFTSANRVLLVPLAAIH